METIKRKSGDRYREMIWINSKPIKSPLFKRKTDARDWKAKQLTLKAQQEILGDSTNLFSKRTLESYAGEWLNIRGPKLQRKSIEAYESYLRLHVNPNVGIMDLKKITRKDIEKLQSKLLEKLSPKRTNCIIIFLTSILEDAVENGFIQKNPAKGVETVKADPPSEAFWSMTDINAFILATEDHDETLCDLVLFALNTGLRRGELAALEWDVIFFNLKTAHIFRTRDQVEQKQRTKTALKRAIPLNTIAMKILEKRFAKRIPGTNHVFTEIDGSLIDIHHLYRRFGSSQDRARISNKIKFHDTRSTFATHFMMNGGDVYQLQKILGHTKIDMTMRYAKFSPQYLQDAVSDFTLGGDLKQFNHILTTARSSEENVHMLKRDRKVNEVEILEAKQ